MVLRYLLENFDDSLEKNVDGLAPGLSAEVSWEDIGTPKPPKKKKGKNGIRIIRFSHINVEKFSHCSGNAPNGQLLLHSFQTNKNAKKPSFRDFFPRHLASFDHFTWPRRPFLTLVVLPRPGPRLPRVEGGPLRDVAGEGGGRAAGAGAGGGQRQFAAEVEEKLNN